MNWADGLKSQRCLSAGNKTPRNRENRECCGIHWAFVWSHLVPIPQSLLSATLSWVREASWLNVHQLRVTRDQWFFVRLHSKWDFERGGKCSSVHHPAQYWPLIGPDRSRDLNTGLWLVVGHRWEERVWAAEGELSEHSAQHVHKPQGFLLQNSLGNWLGQNTEGGLPDNKPCNLWALKDIMAYSHQISVQQNYFIPQGLRFSSVSQLPAPGGLSGSSHSLTKSPDLGTDHSMKAGVGTNHIWSWQRTRGL